MSMRSSLPAVLKDALQTRLEGSEIALDSDFTKSLNNCIEDHLSQVSDVINRFLAIFRSRLIYFEVCTTEDPRK